MSEAARRLLTQACQAMRGSVLAAPRSIDGVSFAGAATDSRQVRSGQLFFALRGERTDGFEHCAAAARAGAAAVVVPGGRGVPAGCEPIPVIAVAEPRAALGELARSARTQFGGKVVGITGSNGKTTTKEMTAAALGAAGPVLRTNGNLNTDVGLPLTVLAADGTEAFWVLEMAMRARGEIAYLAAIARPHVAVVTNVGSAHLGLLGSLDEVARAKGEIFTGLTDDGVAVLPDDEPRLEREAAGLPERRKRRFGFGGLGARAGESEVRILEVVGAGLAGSVLRIAVGDQPLVVRLPLAGDHNARNAAAALAVADALGVAPLQAALALERTALPPHRSRLVAAGGRTILDDSYNANPASMSAAMATALAAVGSGSRAYAVLGDMLELGPEAEALHAALGVEAARAGLAGLVAVGPLAAHIARGAREAGLDRVAMTGNAAAAAAMVAGWTAPGDWVVVKGSRAMGLEHTVAALEHALGGGRSPSPNPGPPGAT
jgi:UDP-N-acetylmuramoyl-tripeptide--D-alanyl-D-alanine ligase